MPHAASRAPGSAVTPHWDDWDMFVSTIEREVREVEQSLVALAGRLDPDGIPASEAPRLFERAGPRSCDAVGSART